MSLLRVHPVVVRARILLRTGTYISEVLDAGHVVRGRAGQVAAGEFRTVEDRELLAAHELRGQLARLGLSALDPMDGARLGELAHAVHPFGDTAAELGQWGHLVRRRGHSGASSFF